MHLFYGIVFKHSRDITVLIALLWLNIVYYSSLFSGLEPNTAQGRWPRAVWPRAVLVSRSHPCAIFSSFYRSTVIPTLVENS